jgi:hypothetical protein
VIARAVIGPCSSKGFCPLAPEGFRILACVEREPLDQAAARAVC